MKYQLAIQFPEEFYGYLDWIADIEDLLEEKLLDAEVDGHDIGCDEVNIFIHTNNPVASFQMVKDILIDEQVKLEIIKAAYRELSGENYTAIWPENLINFQIK